MALQIQTQPHMSSILTDFDSSNTPEIHIPHNLSARNCAGKYPALTQNTSL